MAAKKPAASKTTNDAIDPPAAGDVSHDADNWTYRDSKADWPEDDGPHVEQVYQGITPAKD